MLTPMAISAVSAPFPLLAVLDAFVGGVEVLVVAVAFGVAKSAGVAEGVTPGVPFAVAVCDGWGEPKVPPTTIAVGTGVGVMPG